MQKLQIPPLPFGYTANYFPGRSFSLAGLNRFFHYTPRMAMPYQANYIDKGVSTVNINAGYASGPTAHPGEYAALARANRSVFLGPEYVQDAGGGKPFADFNISDARNAANYAWNRANGYGVITSGAQEGRYDNDPYATYAGSGRDAAFKNLAQAWGEVQSANSGMLYFGNYDGIFYFNPLDNAATLRTALSSNANALAYMQAHIYGPNPYFRSDMEIWRYHPPLLNLYFRSFTDLHAKMFEIRMAIQLTKMALAAVGASWPVMVFVFPGKTEDVSYTGQGYLDRYVRTLSSGGTMFKYDFHDYSHSFQLDQTFTALDKAEHYYGWEDTHLYGTNPNIVHSTVIRGDGFVLEGIDGSTSGITQVNNGPTPYNASSTYPYPSKPEGCNDLAPLAAEMYAHAARYGGQNSQLTRSRIAGGSTWNSLNSGSLVDRFVDRDPFVDYARTGNVGWVKVSGYAAELTGTYNLDVDVGSGQKVTVPVEPTGFNVFEFSSSDLTAH